MLNEIECRKTSLGHAVRPPARPRRRNRDGVVLQTEGSGAHQAIHQEVHARGTDHTPVVPGPPPNRRATRVSPPQEVDTARLPVTPARSRRTTRCHLNQQQQAHRWQQIRRRRAELQWLARRNELACRLHFTDEELEVAMAFYPGKPSRERGAQPEEPPDK